MNESPIENISLADLLSRALMSNHNAVVARVKLKESDAELTFVLQIVEFTVNGVTESVMIDDLPMPPKDQLN